MQKIRLYLVDDHRLVIDTWALLINSDPRFSVIGYTHRSSQALHHIKTFRPDIVLVDVAMAAPDGFQLTRSLVQLPDAPKVIAVSLYHSPSHVRRMLDHGAMGYVSKNSSKEELFTAIAEVYEGRKFLSQDIKDKIVEENFSAGASLFDFSLLTRKQREIIECLRKGLTSREIAQQQCLSPKTIEVHRHNILKRIGVRNVAQLLSALHGQGS